MHFENINQLFGKGNVEERRLSVNPDFDLVNVSGNNQFFIIKYIEL